MNTSFTSFFTKTFILASLFFFSCSPQKYYSSYASANKARNSIVGGQSVDSKFEKTNGVVGLLIIAQKAGTDAQGRPNQSQAICTGSLISKRIILTAAHCLIIPNIQAVLVVFDTDIKAAIGRKNYIEASQIIPNELFNPKSMTGVFTEGKPWNDIGIIELSTDAPSDFSFAKLPTLADMAHLGNQTQLTLAGYGVTNPIVNQVQDVNGKQALVPVTGQADTAGFLRAVSDVSVIQATKDNKELLLDQQHGSRGACHGDSGGPAYLKNSDGTYTLIGITSRGTDLTGNCDQQNVFTNVIGQLDWIKSKASL